MAVAKALPDADIYLYEDDTKIRAFIGVSDGNYIIVLFVKADLADQAMKSSTASNKNMTC